MKTFTSLYSRKHPAFTLIELVLVIVILGILAAIALPRLDRDLTQEAMDNILSDIRYTQHLALTDNMQLYNNSKWEQRYWRIAFSTCSGGGKYYKIGSDKNMESDSNAFFDLNESAIDPANGKPMFWKNLDSCDKGDDTSAASDRIFLTKKYGIDTITSSGGCSSAMHVAFDHIGRPYNGSNFSKSTQPDHKGYMRNDCVFTFHMKNGSTFSITVEKETGYAYISSQPHS